MLSPSLSTGASAKPFAPNLPEDVEPPPAPVRAVRERLTVPPVVVAPPAVPEVPVPRAVEPAVPEAGAPEAVTSAMAPVGPEIVVRGV